MRTHILIALICLSAIALSAKTVEVGKTSLSGKITDKHFHQQEHACSICDFTITDSNNAPDSDIVFIVSSQPFLFSPFIESVNIPFAFSNLPSRAPPIA